MRPKSRFVPEQRVRCINSEGWADHITVGNIYRVAGYLRWDQKFYQWVVVIANDDQGGLCGAFESRFEPVEETA